MDGYGLEAAEALGAWSERALHMYAWPFDPQVDWNRYSCPKCGQFLGTLVQVEGWRYPVVRPDPSYEIPRHEYRGRSLLDLNVQAHLARHAPRWRPRPGRPPYSASRAPVRIIVYRNGRTGFGAAVGTDREIADRVDPDAKILADRRFESHEDAWDFYYRFTFYKPHRERLLARERKRRERSRSRAET